ncbi:MAG TPA: MFS transporter [Acidobacteriota bacterium]
MTATEVQPISAGIATGTRRWTLVTLLAAATFINYLDRGSLAVALPVISKDLGFGPFEQGILLSAFFWTYAPMQIPMGWMVDRYNIKWLYAGAFALWSLSAAGTGLATGLLSLLLFRVLLGLGESVYLPGGMKVVSLHFKGEESAWPSGFFDLGAKLGLATGTAIDVWLLFRFGWRSLFFRTGLAGLIWLIPWLWLYPSRRGRAISPVPAVNWKSLLTNRTLLGISLGFFCWDYFWYFIISWLPSYLYSVRHVSMVKFGIFGSIPYLVFALAEALGGWGAGVLVRRGWDFSRVTKGMIAAGLGIGLLVIPAALVDSQAASIAFLLGASLSGLVCGNLLVIPKVCAPDHEVALWTGVQNFAGNIGGVLAPAITGLLIAQTHSYISSFLLVSAVLVFGMMAYLFLVPTLKPES